MTPNSSIKETSFKIVYNTDAILPVDIDITIWWREHFNEDGMTHHMDLLFICVLTKFLTIFYMNTITLKPIRFMYVKKMKQDLD